jgi:hypothetical protein
MKKPILFLGAILLAVSLAGVTVTTAGGPAHYEVTITNLTRGQSFTPILVASHDAGTTLFELGQPASGELETLAEEGNTGPLTGLLMVNPGVLDVTTSGGLLGPGETKTVSVATRGRFDHISVAAMLIPSNDAFFAVNGVRGPRGRRHRVVRSPAYDSGTEDNDETCASIPGPPYPECGGPGGGAAPPGGEGYVFIHAGMHGIADFDESLRDWRNPVAKITVSLVRGNGD